MSGSRRIQFTEAEQRALYMALVALKADYLLRSEPMPFKLRGDVMDAMAKVAREIPRAEQIELESAAVIPRIGAEGDGIELLPEDAIRALYPADSKMANICGIGGRLGVLIQIRAGQHVAKRMQREQEFSAELSA